MELMAYKFMPNIYMTFDSGGMNGMISLSSDAKAVVVDLGVGDAASSGHEAFAFSITGTCCLGFPIPPAPLAPAKSTSNAVVA
jgi:hypothetical protein